MRLDGGVLGQLDRAHSVELIKKLHEGIGLQQQIEYTLFNWHHSPANTCLLPSELHFLAWATRAFLGSCMMQLINMSGGESADWSVLAWFPCIPCLGLLTLQKSSYVMAELMCTGFPRSGIGMSEVPPNPSGI